MTASFPNRNIVVASVQTGCDITPAHQVGDEIPDTRENGGDLQVGDTFYNTEEEIIYFYDEDSWVPMGGPGFISPIFDLLQSLEQRVTELEGTGEM